MKPSLVEKALNKILPHRNITKNGELYLRRYYLTPKWFPVRLYIHFIRMPDVDRAEHDHPWWFITTILKGGYTENVLSADKLDKKLVPHIAGEVLYRPASYTHKITYVMPGTWTFVIAGPYRKTWGFWEGKKFTPFREYLGLEAGAAVDD